MGSLSRPFHSVGLGDEEIFCLSFSPYEWSKNFLAIGTENKVVVANVQYENVSTFCIVKTCHYLLDTSLCMYCFTNCFCYRQDEIQFNVIREFHHFCPVVSLSWSALSSSDTVPKVCKFATAGIDGKIRIYASDLAQSENVLVTCLAYFESLLKVKINIIFIGIEWTC